jgi:hypothetical protein
MSNTNKYSNRTCEQLKVNGEPCQSAALRGKKFCYYHEHSGPPQIDISDSAAIPPIHFYLPLLDDAASIQAAITQVCEHLLHRRIEPKRAGVLLYAMQVASSNLGRLKLDRENREDTGNQEISEQEISKHELSKHENDQGIEGNSADASTPLPASSETAANNKDESDPTSSAEADRFPPGTIQACAQPRRSRSALRVLRQ